MLMVGTTCPWSPTSPTPSPCWRAAKCWRKVLCNGVEDPLVVEAYVGTGHAEPLLKVAGLGRGTADPTCCTGSNSRSAAADW